MIGGIFLMFYALFWIGAFMCKVALYVGYLCIYLFVVIFNGICLIIAGHACCKGPSFDSRYDSASQHIHIEKEPEETDDVWIYTELEAYSKQIKVYRNLIKANEMSMNRAQYINNLTWEKRMRLNQSSANYECKVAGLEKKIRKIGQKYNIEVESYLE